MEERRNERQQRMQQRGRMILAGICPTCKAKIEQRVQQGQHVVAMPCGCKLYVGKA